MNIEFKENFNIKPLTTFKIGGVVSRIYFPKNKEELIYLLKTEANSIVLGSCSNVLFSSSGYNGVIISTKKLNNYIINDNLITAESGVIGPFLSQKALDNSLSGFEFMVAFPGSIGGNIYMNAGAHGQTISDKLVSVTVYDLVNKSVKSLLKTDLNFEYRYSLLQNNQYILLDATFEMTKADKIDITSLMSKNIEFRKSVQPSLSYPNAGSVFKNTRHYSAGKLLDEAGAKDIIVDNLKVWDKHANFIINTGNATSENVLELMLKMYESVDRLYNIKLVPEIKFIGVMSKREEEICKVLYQKIQK